jgi:hypothetical protein
MDTLPTPPPASRPAPRNTALYVAMIPLGTEYRPGIYIWLNKKGAAHMRRELGGKGVPVQTWRVTQPAPDGCFQIVRDPTNEIGSIPQSELLRLGVPPFVLGVLVRRFISNAMNRERELWLAQPGSHPEAWFGSDAHQTALKVVHGIVAPLLRELLPLDTSAPNAA